VAKTQFSTVFRFFFPLVAVSRRTEDVEFKKSTLDQHQIGHPKERGELRGVLSQSTVANLVNRPGFCGGWLVLIMRLLSISADYVRIVPQTRLAGYTRWAQGVVFG
jgi:hypothetical protein